MRSKTCWVRSTPKNRNKRLASFDISPDNVVSGKRKSTSPFSKNQKLLKDEEVFDPEDTQGEPVIVIERIRPSHKRTIDSQANDTEKETLTTCKKTNIIFEQDSDESEGHEANLGERKALEQNSAETMTDKKKKKFVPVLNNAPKKATVKIVKRFRTQEEEQKLIKEFEVRLNRQMQEQQRLDIMIAEEIIVHVRRLGGSVDMDKLCEGKIAYRGKWQQVPPLLHLVSHITWPINRYCKLSLTCRLNNSDSSSKYQLFNLSFVIYDLEEHYWKKVTFLKDHSSDAFLFADMDTTFPICTLISDRACHVHILDLDDDYVEGPLDLRTFFASLEPQEEFIDASQRSLSQRSYISQQTEQDNASQVVVCSLYNSHKSNKKTL